MSSPQSEAQSPYERLATYGRIVAAGATSANDATSANGATSATSANGDRPAPIFQLPEKGFAHLFPPRAAETIRAALAGTQ